MNWERIDEYTERAKTHKGWLVRVLTHLDNGNFEGVYVTMTFVPDPMHSWAL